MSYAYLLSVHSYRKTENYLVNNRGSAGYNKLITNMSRLFPDKAIELSKISADEYYLLEDLQQIIVHINTQIEIKHKQ